MTPPPLSEAVFTETVHWSIVTVAVWAITRPPPSSEAVFTETVHRS
eukprot:CAMPEP_0171905826 /NCGR_PEP_ID=MMETSP0993-20121228/5463_1 /TAXON_ID=483369 /ORGANISM="non described non described, Strain CCMP2098" /LENGTH=45 /DNA_ID= /DNA_START= /DNA_END= /DNA_ORIENTATION=